MNYKREQNIPRIIESLKEQTVPCKIFLWNNSEKPFQDHRVDLVINSSKNLRCWPRWSMVAYTNTPYIMTHDDDFLLESSQSLEILIDELSKNYEKGRAIGFAGVRLGSDLSYYPSDFQKSLRKLRVYKGAKHITLPSKTKTVDVLKGRLIMCMKKDLENFPVFTKEIEYSDDIFVSSFLSDKKLGHHLVTGALNGMVTELEGGKGEMALSQINNWEELRNSYAKMYFGGSQIN